MLGLGLGLTRRRGAGAAVIVPPLLEDTFTGTGSPTAHTPEVGGPWVLLRGWFEDLAGGRLICSTNNSVLAVDIGASDCEIEAVLGATGSGKTIGLALRSNADGTDRYQVVVDKYNNKIALRKNDSELAAYQPTPAIDVEDWSLKTWVYDNLIRVYYSGSNYIEYYDTTDPLTKTNRFGISGAGWAGGTTVDSITIREATDWKRMIVIGDSISVYASGQSSWVGKFAHSYNDARLWVKSFAVGGYTIAAQMAGEAAATADQNADICIMHMGTNDSNAGDMEALQATVEAAIDTVRTNNPGCVVYYMNVLPRTSGEVDKSNIRTAIAAACAAKSVTCWDTVTDPWVNMTVGQDSDDGLHPNEAGYTKIANKLLTLVP